MTIWTIGHSTHSIEEFIELLQAHGIQQLIDIRTLPGSKRHPHYNQENLEASLAEAGIHYRHMKGLGGLRKPKPDSPNLGWKNSGFRGYADYMQSEAFQEELAELIKLGKKKPTAMMCAEALPWRCHRNLVADALSTKDVETRHIMTLKQAPAHRRTAFAKVKNGKLGYPKS